MTEPGLEGGVTEGRVGNLVLLRGHVTDISHKPVHIIVRALLQNISLRQKRRVNPRSLVEFHEVLRLECRQH